MRSNDNVACLLAGGMLAVAAMLAVDGVMHAVAAQSPFGARPAAAEAPVSGLVGWLLAKQSEFYREISSTIRAAKSDGSAVWALLGISFAYGIFHAAGPGHGKAVISSYLVANEETWRRGVVLSFISAAIQSVVAVIIVLIAAILLEATAKTIGWTVHVIEIVSYALGAWPAPFGIALQLDRLGALMLLLTAVLAVCCLLGTSGDDTRRGRYFRALFQFQLMGLNGAFLAGDLFNLFVFFELLLIASYALLLHGGGARRVRNGLHYLLMNLVGSSFFLIAIGVRNLLPFLPGRGD